MQENARINQCDKALFDFYHLCKKRQLPKNWIFNYVQFINSAISSNAPKFHGYTLLHFAVMCIDRKAVCKLLDNQADFTIKNAKGQTPLHLGMTMILTCKKLKKMGSRNSGMELILDKMLVFADKYMYANPIDNMGLSHFHIACYNGSHKTVLGFIKHGVELNNIISFNSIYWPGFTSMHVALKYSQLNSLQLLLHYNGDVINSKDAFGLYPLHYALKNHKRKIIDFLFSNCNQHFEKSVKRIGMSLLHVYGAYYTAHWNLDEVLQFNKDVHMTVSSDSPVWAGYTPLLVAINYRNDAMINVLIDKFDADINIMDINGISSLRIAINKQLINEYKMKLILKRYNRRALQPVEDKKLYKLICASLGQKLDMENLLKENCEIVKEVVPLNYPLDLPGYSALHFAVEQGDVEVVELLLSYGADPSVQDKNLTSPLHLAAARGNFQILKKMLSVYGVVNTNPSNSEGLSHLHIACMCDNVSLIEEFLNLGVSVNSPTKDGQSPLHFAARHGSENSAKLLLDREADFTAQDANGASPLHLAVKAKNERIVDMILSLHHKRLANPVSCTGLSHFHIACAKNQRALVRTLLKSGLVEDEPVKFNADFCPGYTALHFAVKHNCRDTVKVLLEEGASATGEDASRKLPLHYTSKLSRRDSKSILDLFWYSGGLEDLQAIGTTGLSNLHVACARDDPEAIERISRQHPALRSRRTSRDCPRWPGYSPLHFAAKYGGAQSIELLLSHDPRLLGSRDAHGFEALHVACSSANRATAEALLARGSDPTSRTSRGLTPLRLALQADEPEIARTLLGQPLARIIGNPTDNRGLSYFHVAFLEKRLSLVRDFLEAGVEPNGSVHPVAGCSKFAGCSLLLVSLLRQDARMAELLLSHGADARELLSLAVERSRTAFVRLALDYRADPGSALELAIRLGREKTMQLLLESGARFHDDQILSCILQTARENDDEDYWVRTILRLQEHGFDVDECSLGGHKSALHEAYWPLKLPLLRALLRCGADVNAEDRSGRSLVSYHLEIQTSRMPLSELRYMIRRHLGLRCCVPGFELSATNEALHRTILELDGGDKDPQLETRCRAELARMRTMSFGVYSSLYRLFRRPETEMAWCLMNPELRRFLGTKLLEDSFPECCCLIRMQYVKAWRRNRLLGPALSVLVNILFARSGEARNGEDCARNILNFLDNRDLRTLALILSSDLSLSDD